MNGDLSIIADEVQKIFKTSDENNSFHIEQFNQAAAKFHEKIDSHINARTALEKEIKNIDILFQCLACMKSELFAKKNELDIFCLQAMKSYPELIFKGKLGSFLIRKSSAVIIEDETKIPQAFLKAKTTYIPLKKDIKRAIKVGLEIPGVKLEYREKLEIVKEKNNDPT